MIVTGNPNDDLYTGRRGGARRRKPSRSWIYCRPMRFSSVRAGNSRDDADAGQQRTGTNALRFDVVHAQAEFAGGGGVRRSGGCQVALTRVPQGNLHLPLVSRVGPLANRGEFLNAVVCITYVTQARDA